MMKKVLVIDDDPDMLVSLKSSLEAEGFETEVVAQWEKIYTQVRVFKPDVVLMDVQLRGMDGRIICQHIKDTADIRHIPVIMVSANPNAGHRVREYGADCFLEKPFATEQLVNILEQYKEQ